MSRGPTDWPAWLEDADGRRVAIKGSCSLGRSDASDVAIPDDRVSRRHALIQMQGEQEFWLVDFGSRNGTYLNDQRIIRPTRLRHADRIKVGHVEFAFHQPQSAHRDASKTVLADKTVNDIRSAKCWLLVADIIGSTNLVKELPPDELPLLTGLWVAECKQTIESHGGRINQFLGDGFFAYWHDRERVEIAVGNALQVLRRLQDTGRPPFRFATHLGPVMIGGVSVGEEERISGREVHFAFRAEKLASKLGESRLLSSTAWERLAAVVEAKEVGRHRLQGFDGDFAFYAI
jgi:adenylate cyclase